MGNYPYYHPFYGYINPYYSMQQVQTQRVQDFGYVRILPTVVGLNPLDLYVDDKKIASNISYGNPINYLPVLAGTRKFVAYPTGTKDNPVLTSEVNVMKDMYFTFAVIDQPSNVRPMIILDNVKPNDKNNVNIRAIHLAYDAPTVDVLVKDQGVLFSNIDFEDITPYVTKAPQNFTFDVTLAGNKDTVVLRVPNQNLKKNRNYTLYIIGEAQKETLKMLVLPDGRIIS